MNGSTDRESSACARMLNQGACLAHLNAVSSMALLVRLLRLTVGSRA